MKEVEKSTFNADLFVLVLYRFHHYPLSAIELAPNAPYFTEILLLSFVYFLQCCQSAFKQRLYPSIYASCPFWEDKYRPYNPTVQL